MKFKLLSLLTVAALLPLSGCGKNKKDNLSSDNQTTDTFTNTSDTSASTSVDDRPTYDVFAYGNYYQNCLSWTDGADLKQKLNAAIHEGYQAIPYAKPNWESNQFADQALDDFECVDVVYSANNELKTATNTGSTGWQREHAFPAMLMTGLSTGDAVKTPGKATDFHNLFASYSSGNSSRSSRNYGEVDPNNVPEGGEYTCFGTLEDGYENDGYTFEPGDMDKGRLARAIFYMCTMYPELIIREEPSTTAEAKDSTNPVYAHGNLSILLKWSKNIAVDRKEYQHNESVYSHVYTGTNVAQGNRNPYIDYPELIDYVYGDKQNEAGELKYIEPSCETLNIKEGGIANYAIQTATREYNVGDTFTKNDYTIVAVNNDFTTATAVYDDTTADYTFTENDVGVKELTIATPINLIKINAKVIAEGFAACCYKHVVTGFQSGQDFEGLKESSDVDNEVTLSGVTWLVRWKQNKLYQYSESKGLAFGTGTAPVDTLSFTTKESFTFNSKSLVDAVFVKANCASGKSYNIVLKVGDTVVKQTTIEYDKTGPQIYGDKLETAIEGKVSIVITNITAAVYIHTLAVNAIAAE